MNNYTKGKWRAMAGYSMDELYFIYVMSGDKHIARVDDEDKSICEANAQLIAKAPRMWGVLKQLADWDAGKFGKESNIKIIEISKLASALVAKSES